MKSVLAMVTLALVALVVEEKARQVAGEAQYAVGEAVGQARDATDALKGSVERQPLAGVLIAAACGYVVALLVPRR